MLISMPIPIIDEQILVLVSSHPMHDIGGTMWLERAAAK